MLWITFVIPDIGLPIENAPIQRLWYEITPLIGIILTTIVFVKLVEKNTISIPIFKKVGKDILLSFIVGVAWIGLPLLLLYTLGMMKYAGINPVSNISIWILAVILNAAMQEILMRGYLYQLYKRESGALTAVIITTAIFTLMHGGAFEAGLLAVLNVITMSLFVTIMLEYTDNLLGPIVVHSIWNVVGGIGFGLVALADDYPSLINFEMLGNRLLTGGTYGLEGSVLTLGINIILCAIFAYGNLKRNNKRLPGIFQLPET